MKVSSTGLVSCCSSIFGMLHVYHVLPRRLSFSSHFFSLSFFNSHPSNRVLFFALRASEQVHFEYPPARLCGCSQACGCFVSNSFDKNASSWCRDSILRPSERMSTILPKTTVSWQVNISLLVFFTIWHLRLEA